MTTPVPGLDKKALQSYWDYYVISGWRRFHTLQYATQRFHTLSGMWPFEAGLLRAPDPTNTALKQAMRAWVHQRLPKVDEWLQGNGPDRDVELLRKLAESDYDSLDRNWRTDRSQVSTYRAVHKQEGTIKARRSLVKNTRDVNAPDIVKPRRSVLRRSVRGTRT